jgi:signal transduction histidine kinase
MLFTQFTILHSRALLVLASGYFFTALIVIPHALTFPGVIAPTELLGGVQSAPWLYVFWHLGLPLAVIVYALLKDAAKPVSEGRVVTATGSSAAAVLVLVCGLTWIAIAPEMHLPRFFDDAGHLRPLTIFINAFMLFLGVVALALVWFRRRSVLDLWLMIVLFAFLIEVVLGVFLASSRYSLGFYAARLYSLVTAVTVLIALLSETTALYANLARSDIRRRSVREARQIAMDAMAASIAHEINQPLGAIVANGNAGLRWLTRATPDLDEARATLKRIVDDGQRASQVIGGIRSMFRKNAHGRLLLDVNDLIREALTMVDLDLLTQRVSVATDLRNGLPQLLADRGQLQQVFLNLITNAIEAMGSLTDRARVLRVRTDFAQKSANVLVTIEDSGMGITAEENERIFEPFFTTKSAGTGIGLTICRSIIDSHGGSLRASANKPYGTIFQVTLPTGDL